MDGAASAHRSIPAKGNRPFGLEIAGLLSDNTGPRPVWMNAVVRPRQLERSGGRLMGTLQQVVPHFLNASGAVFA